MVAADSGTFGDIPGLWVTNKRQNFLDPLFKHCRVLSRKPSQKKRENREKVS